MKSRIALLIPASFLVFAATASAQLRQGTVEINGFGGWLFGGEIAHTHGFNNDFDHNHIDVGDDAAYGGRVGYNITGLFGTYGGLKYMTELPRDTAWTPDALAGAGLR